METITGAEVDGALSTLGWRVVAGAARIRYATGDFATGVRLVQQVAVAAEEAQHHPDVDLRYGVVQVSLSTHAVDGLTQADVDLARTVSRLAQELGVAVASAPPQTLDVAIDALDIASVRPFWEAVLGYVQDGDGALVEPDSLGLYVWFQQMDAPRPQRNRIHLDINVPEDLARARVEAAVAAGGVLVTDRWAPAWWVLADAEGNEACISTWRPSGQG